MKNRMGSEQNGDLIGGVLKNKRRAGCSQDVTPAMDVIAGARKGSDNRRFLSVDEQAVAYCR